jgi:hypothetical protein
MSSFEKQESLRLPERTRLLHIGPMKTGSTALQNAARQARKQMYEHGAYYPGTALNHRQAAWALMERATDRKGAPPGTNKATAQQVPPMAEWDALVDDINAEPDRRILISDETIAGASTKISRKFVNKLGPDRTHIAITLRPPSSTLPARWIQFLKDGQTDTFEDWLKRVYGKDNARPVAARTRRYQDQAGVVERWAEIVGAKNVTVIIADKSKKELLTDTFEQLLGLPAGVLTGTVTDGASANRSMSQPEAETFRLLNQYLEENEVPWPVYRNVIKLGAVPHMLGHRTPEAEEARVRMPRWAAELAVRDGKSYAERIRQSGVRVVGDLEHLSDPPSVAPDAHDLRSIPEPGCFDRRRSTLRRGNRRCKK